MSDVSAQQHLLPVDVFLTMMTIGLELKLNQFPELLKSPRVPLLGSLIHTFTFPVVALVVIMVLQLLRLSPGEATTIGILLIAACPSGGFSNILTMIARANLALSIVLTAVSTLFSLVTVPLLLFGFGYLVVELRGPVEIPVDSVLFQLTFLVFMPIVIGMTITARFDWFSAEQVTRMQKLAQTMLYLVVGLMIAENWGTMKSGFIDALPLSLLLCFVNISACFGLSRATGLNPEDAVTVSLEGSTRNLAVAILVSAHSLQRMDIAVLPTIYFLSVLVVSIFFAKTWRSLLAATMAK